MPCVLFQDWVYSQASGPLRLNADMPKIMFRLYRFPGSYYTSILVCLHLIITIKQNASYNEACTLILTVKTQNI